MILLLLQTSAARTPFTAKEWAELIGSVEKLLVAVIAAIGGLFLIWLQNRSQGKQNETIIKQNELIVDQNVTHERNATERAVLRGDQMPPQTVKAPFPGERASDDP
jgi:hypothetical protein